jgi:hypothetical protein
MAEWKSIWTICSEELMNLLRPQADSWHEFGNRTAPAEAVEQDFALGELPHLSEVAAAIDAWTSDGRWPDDLSDGARHCIRMRLNAAADFVYLLFDSRAPAQFLSAPDCSDREVLRWLLTDWWDRHGRWFFAREISVIEPPIDEAEAQ